MLTKLSAYAIVMSSKQNSKGDKLMNLGRLRRLIVDNSTNMDVFARNEILQMIDEEIAKEAEKKAGRKPVIRNAIKKFLSKDNSRPILQKANVRIIDGVKYYGYCDGFKLAWSPIDFGFGESAPEESFKFETLVKDVNKATKVVKITPEFKKRLAETFIKAGTRYRVVFDVECDDGMIVRLNADYLKSCIDFTNASEMLISTPSAPVYFIGEDNRNALCLPIRR